ncbi:MAG: aspartate--tRNA ligase [Candidatus Westeberhardia cardiocondylae]|nr:aspartate--tRNA ligase [Candidatus Westeberhardia cardiocondylae]
MNILYCGQLNKTHINKKVTLYGWVNNFRNLGNIIFIEIRDWTGIIQIFVNINKKEIFLQASKVRHEFCVKVQGIVCVRPKNQINHNMSTGFIEICTTNLIILNESKPLPIDNNKKNIEEKRLKFRYLDLRRPIMINRLKTRAKVNNIVRNFMNTNKFLEIETPILSKITLEGAKNFLIKTQQEKFFSLPQSPQIFKQLLMISGFNRYYQITKCFRNEDSRSDRQPEFTQIDIEASFTTSKKIIKITEKLICKIWKKILGIKLKKFQQITYYNSIKKFGSDKPDLRNPIEFYDITNIIKNDKLKMIFELDNIKHKIISMRLPNCIKFNQQVIDNYYKYKKLYKIKNKEILWIKIYQYHNETYEIKSSIINIINQKTINNIIIKSKGCVGDTLILLHFNNDKNIIKYMNKLRINFIKNLNIINNEKWSPLWIINFPMFKQLDDKTIIPTHHPFSAPKKIKNINNLIKRPLSIISDSYDMIINGYEIGSGSVRINTSKMQKIIFDILNLNTKQQKKMFDFFLNALKYGTPPHAGFAFGLDRIMMLLTNTNNIRDIIAFPKTTSGIDLMTDSPNYL